MRILHVVHQYPPEHMGGTELYTQTVAQAAAALGHTVTVYTYGGPRHGRARKPRGRSHRPPRLAVTSVRGGVICKLLAGHLSGHLRKYWPTAKPDVVHVQHGMGLPMVMSTC